MDNVLLENLNWVTIVILFAVLQGIFLFFSIGRFGKNTNSTNKYLALFILFVSLLLLGRFFHTKEIQTLYQQKLLFVGDFVIFLYGPLLFFYLIKLFGIKSKVPTIFHFVPVILFLLFTVPIFIANQTEFINYLRKYSFTFPYWEGFAILVNVFYLVVNWNMLNRFIISSENYLSFSQQTRFFKWLMIIILISLTAWIVNFLAAEMEYGNFGGYHLVWITLSGSIILLGYYSMSNPEVFIIPELKEEKDFKPNIYIELGEIAEKVERIMNDDKPYLDSKLTLKKLADLTDITPHQLSKVINEVFNKNFFLFVNYYRVNEFKTLVKKEDNNNFTFLSLAYDSGFNSKTTFNTAFKKITNLTPRDYLSKYGK